MNLCLRNSSSTKLTRFLRGINANFKDFSTIRRNVLVSSSNDIYTNLAVEDWLYKNRNFDSEELLLLWRNTPCVVIGRHQNPWLECNLKYLKNNEISLARRNSGGGTVYHDLGNLNCTFFTNRKMYNRKRNLQLICDAIEKHWKLDVTVSPREDILLDGQYKISGTAAKLGNANSYHHCTILFDANKEMLQNSLDKPIICGIDSKATGSVKGVITNLCDEMPEIDFWSLVKVISQEYSFQEGNNWEIVHPDENVFPGLHKIREGLSHWNWIFGHTPRFIVSKQFSISPDQTNLVQVQESETQRESHQDLSRSSSQALPVVTVTVNVYHAKIEAITITPESFLPSQLLNSLQNLVINRLFQAENIFNAMNSFCKNNLNVDSKLIFILKCLQDMIKRT